MRPNSAVANYLLNRTNIEDEVLRAAVSGIYSNLQRLSLQLFMRLIISVPHRSPNMASTSGRECHLCSPGRLQSSAKHVG